MINRRTILGSAGTLLAQALVSNAQIATPARKTVLEQDLPNVDLRGWVVNAAELTYAPGGSSAAHRHPGITLVYVLEGEIRSRVGDNPEKIYRAGEMFLETPGELHGVSANASSSKPAKFLAILLAEKGKPLTTPA